jgi:IS1 family transposase
MNRLSPEDRARILQMLCEGMSIRSIERVERVSKNTVLKLLVDAGQACAALHHQMVHKVEAKRIQCDEIWSFCYAKDRTVRTGKELPDGAGDVWTWTAIDADTKLILSYFVGDRSRRSACAFMSDLHMRVKGRPQITTDQWRGYVPAVDMMFGPWVDFAQLVKIFRSTPGDPGRYSPGECCGTKAKVHTGDPDPAHISTSYVERQNLTMRMSMRRFTRLTNGFSKKLDNHICAIALHFAYYNFVRIHSSLRITPAMAAGVTDRLWEISDIVKLIEDAEGPPKKRGPYKKTLIRI